MIRSSGLLYLGMFFFSIAGANAQSANSKLVSFWIDALNHHDLDALSNLYSDSIQLESPNWTGIKTGKAEAKEVFSRYFTSTPDLKYELVNLVESPDAVVVEYISGGTLQNPEKGTPEYMTGKKYSLKNCTRINLQNGKMSKQVSYFDQISFLKQVGFFDQQH